MNEAQVNGTQDEVKQGEDALDDGATIEESLAGDDGGPDAERLRRLRMKEFLRDLVRQEGKMEAAEILGVNHKTLTRAEDSGEITGRMSDALELLLRRADDAEVARLREAVVALEERVATLEGGVEAPDARAQGGGVDECRRKENGGEDKPNAEAQEKKADDTGAQKEDGKPDDGEGRLKTGATSPAGRLRPINPHTGRPLDPEIVTVEPADDDVEVYGDAWSLVERWRRLRDGHPNQGSTLSWLENEERLLVLELAMLEEHGLTLPPEKQPLRGFGRDGQSTHRWRALADTRVALRKRRLLRWVRRILTFNLWRN